MLTHVSHDADAVPETSPFDKSRLVCAAAPAAYVGRATSVRAAGAVSRNRRDQRKHYQLAERLADLFDQYQVYRADRLDAWANGHDATTLEASTAL